MIDDHDQTVEIKVAVHEDGHRVWIHVGKDLVVRVYRARVILDIDHRLIGKADDLDGEFDE